MADDTVIDILQALIRTDPADRALDEARKVAEGQRTQEQQITLLAAHVAALQRSVATLTDLLVRSGALDDADRRTIARAARRPRVDFYDDDTDDADADQPRAEVASPYRGGSPLGGIGCAVCRKALGPDDPELTLAARGRVCTLCFTRGG